jgi:hypothetical protein
MVAERFELGDRIHDGPALGDREAHQFLPRIVVPAHPEHHNVIIAKMRSLLSPFCYGSLARFPAAQLLEDVGDLISRSRPSGRVLDTISAALTSFQANEAGRGRASSSPTSSTWATTGSTCAPSPRSGPTRWKRSGPCRTSHCRAGAGATSPTSTAAAGMPTTAAAPRQRPPTGPVTSMGRMRTWRGEHLVSPAAVGSDRQAETWAWLCIVPAGPGRFGSGRGRGSN